MILKGFAKRVGTNPATLSLLTRLAPSQQLNVQAQPSSTMNNLFATHLLSRTFTTNNNNKDDKNQPKKSSLFQKRPPAPGTQEGANSGTTTAQQS